MRLAHQAMAGREGHPGRAGSRLGLDCGSRGELWWGLKSGRCLAECAGWSAQQRQGRSKAVVRKVSVGIRAPTAWQLQAQTAGERGRGHRKKTGWSDKTHCLWELRGR